jgi:Tol biopolymer transport system component
VAFASASTNLTPESVGGDVQKDLYVRDTQTDTTTYVARNASASVQFGFARFLPDGEHLLFASPASDVVPGAMDTNDESDLFLHDLGTGEKTVVTINAAGNATSNTQGTSHDDVVVSSNGRYVAFVSDADDLVEDFASVGTRDVFIRDLEAGVTSLVTVYINGGGGGYDQGATRDPEFSPDSRFLIFNTNALLASQVTTALNFFYAQHLYAFDVVTRAQNLLTVNAAANAPATGGGLDPFSFIVSPAGGSVVFMSTATDMVAGVADTTPFSYDIFLADLPTEGGASQCADPVADASVKASDSLYILRTAVGSETCSLCVCDVDGSGAVTATDALVTLKAAVGQSVSLQCPAC